MLIHEKINAILADSDAIAKDKRNQSQGFNFRGIDDVYNALHPILAKHGVFSTTQVIGERSEERTTKAGSTLIYRILTVKFTFYAADGSCVESIIIGEGMDSGDKASNKAMAIAHKYALLQLLAIPTEDTKDPDAESHEVQPKASTKTATKPITTATDGLRQRAIDLYPEIGMTDADFEAILLANGGKNTLIEGKRKIVGQDWKKVVDELVNRQNMEVGMDAAFRSKP